MNLYELKILVPDNVNIEKKLQEIKKNLNEDKIYKANIYFTDLNKHYMMYPDDYADANSLQA